MSDKKRIEEDIVETKHDEEKISLIEEEKINSDGSQNFNAISGCQTSC